MNNFNKQGSISVETFFKKFVLEISEYQRPYVWTGNQIINLYDDLVEFSSSKTDKPDYYLGNIILVKNEYSNNYKIIDGQQRIISLLIITKVLDTVFYEKPFTINSSYSIDNISKNSSYLKHHVKSKSNFQINWANINITYIIAENDDQAFKFYTTLSTSGKRLVGIDIIKPFHLQAIPKEQQKEKAIQLEKFQFDENKLENIIKILLRARYWKGIDFKDFPRNHVDENWKIELENEFVNNTKDQLDDNKYLFGIQSKQLIQFITPSYKTDQPINKGINAINYFLYFAELWDKIINRINEIGLGIINEQKNVSSLQFNQEYFQAVLLTFVSKFGHTTLYEDDFIDYLKLLFKICFYTRLDIRVSKKTISSFEEETKLINRILVSYDKKEINDFCSNYINLKILKIFDDIEAQDFKGRPTLKHLHQNLSIDTTNLTNPFFN